MSAGGPTMNGVRRKYSGRGWRVADIVILSVLVLALLWTSLMWLFAARGGSAYGNENYDGATSSYRKADGLTPTLLGEWRLPYSRGTTYLADGAPDTGVPYLEKALDLVPKAETDESGMVVDPDHVPECQVRRNLSVGYEMKGDAAADSGDAESSAQLYEQAVQALHPCYNGEGNSDVEQRQDDKQQEQQQQQDQDPTDDPTKNDPEPTEEPDDGDNEPSPEPTMSEEEEELQRRNQEGEQQYQRQQGDDDGSGGSGGVNW